MTTPLIDALPLNPYSKPPSDYYGLLTDPPGRYGIMKYGNTLAITLHGSNEFVRRATNLFSSFGGESKRISGNITYRYPTTLNLRQADRPDTWFFCIPAARIRMALILYLYGQIYQHKAQVQNLIDSDGDFMDTLAINEDNMWVEAQRLADSFIFYEIKPDYSVRALDVSHMGVASVESELTVFAPQREAQDQEE